MNDTTTAPTPEEPMETMAPSAQETAPDETMPPTPAMNDTMETMAPSTMDTNMAPTVAPSAEDMTMAPTGMLTVVVPFSLMYMIDPTLSPSQTDINTIESITDRFLQEILNLNFDFDPDTTMEDFGITVIMNVDANGVVTVDYEATVAFGMDSVVVPTMEDVNMQLMVAFQDVNLQVYLDLMQNTGDNNAFSSTTDVIYGPPTTRAASLSTIERYRLSGKQMIGVVGAGVIVALGFGIMFLESKYRAASRHRKVFLTI